MKFNKDTFTNITLNFVITIGIVAIYNIFIVSQQQDEIEDIVDEQIAGLNLNINEKIKKIDLIEKKIIKLDSEITEIKQYLQYFDKKLKEKVKIKRDNIFITEAMRKMLDEIKDKLKEENKNNKTYEKETKKIKFENQLKNEKEESKKIQKPQKYHISVPSIFEVKRVEKIDNKIYLYLVNGEVITKNNIFYGLKILNINLERRFVLAKIIDRNAYEYGKIVKIPYVLIFSGVNYSNYKENAEKLRF